MKKKLFFVLVVLVGFFLMSCSTTVPVAGASGVVGSKTGEASQAYIGHWGGFPFGYPLNGEGGIYQAAKNGGIRRVGTVDERIDWPASPVIPYVIVTTVVSGE